MAAAAVVVQERRRGSRKEQRDARREKKIQCPSDIHVLLHVPAYPLVTWTNRRAIDIHAVQPDSCLASLRCLLARHLPPASVSRPSQQRRSSCSSTTTTATPGYLTAVVRTQLSRSLRITPRSAARAGLPRTAPWANSAGRGKSNCCQRFDWSGTGHAYRAVNERSGTVQNFIAS
ncbi:hypothetical protein BKA81DRAFT_343679 [Phyllosticta paracitricarpa]